MESWIPYAPTGRLQGGWGVICGSGKLLDHIVQNDHGVTGGMNTHCSAAQGFGIATQSRTELICRVSMQVTATGHKDAVVGVRDAGCNCQSSAGRLACKDAMKSAPQTHTADRGHVGGRLAEAACMAVTNGTDKQVEPDVILAVSLGSC